MTIPSSIDIAAVKAVCALVDQLVPGDGHRWPAASDAIRPIDRALEEFGREDLPWLVSTAQKIVALPEDKRGAALLSLEATEAVLFERLVGAVYRAYYASVTVLNIVDGCAAAGPREPSPHFDPSLVAKVLATRAGQRRL